MFDREFGPQYLDKYICPTLEYFNKSVEEMESDSKVFCEKLHKREYKHVED